MRPYRLSLVGVLLGAALLALFPLRSDDIFMHLAVGRRILQEGWHFADPDPFLYSLPGHRTEFLNQWGTHLLAFGLYRLGGFSLLVVFKALLVVVGASAPFWLAARLEVRSFLVPALSLLALWAGCDRFIERSSLFSDVAGAGVLALVGAELHQPSRRRWLLPPIFLLWANVHTGFLTGLFFVFLGGLTQWRAARRWFPLALACLLACSIHPRGPALVASVLHDVAGSGYQAYRQANFEWLSTLDSRALQTREVQRLLVLLAAVTGLIIWRGWHRRAVPWFSLLVLIALAYLGQSAIRFVTTVSFALPVLVVDLLADSPLPLSFRRERALQGAVLLLALGLCVKVAEGGYVTKSGPRHLGLGLDDTRLPLMAADYVHSLPLTGHLFNEHEFGSLLAWRFDGKPPLYYHGFVDDLAFYERDYLGVNRSPEDFAQIVDHYQIDLFFLRRRTVTPTAGPLLHQILLTAPMWKLIYWDDSAMVFLRDRPQYRKILERDEIHYLDPFRPDRLDVGLQRSPGEVRAEALRLLHYNPSNRMAQDFFRVVLKEDPR